MTTELPEDHGNPNTTEPLALKFNEGLGPTPRFARTYCSQCGGEFGPSDSGFSHCSDHTPAAANLPTTGGVMAEVVRFMRATGYDWQDRCIAEGFKYWRATDAHGVTCSKEQAETMLAAVLGVEVGIGA